MIEDKEFYDDESNIDDDFEDLLDDDIIEKISEELTD